MVGYKEIKNRKKDLRWLIYLADKTKLIMFQSEVEKRLTKIPDEGEYIVLKEPLLIDGVEVISMVREDCSQFIPNSQQQEKERTIN